MPTLNVFHRLFLTGILMLKIKIMHYSNDEKSSVVSNEKEWSSLLKKNEYELGKEG